MSSTSPPNTVHAHNNADMNAQAVLPTRTASIGTSLELLSSMLHKSLTMHHDIQLCIVETMIEEIMSVTQEAITLHPRPRCQQC